MKLFALVSVIALTAATGAFAQSAAPLAAENPNNCSPASKNCVQNESGSNKSVGNTEGTSRNAVKTQQGVMSGGPAVQAQNPNNCSAADPKCVTNESGSNKTVGNTESTAQSAEKTRQQSQMPATGGNVNIKAGTACPPGQSTCASEPASQRGEDSGSASRGAAN